MLIRTPLVLAFLTAIVAACGSSTSPANSCGSAKADANVNATDQKNFSPSATTITHGQTVCWQNNGSLLHSVTDNGGAFDTDLPSGQIFLHTYPVAGTYPYHCKYHAGMTGTITVN